VFLVGSNGSYPLAHAVGRKALDGEPADGVNPDLYDLHRQCMLAKAHISI
jgi:hypothetical protein